METNIHFNDLMKIVLDIFPNAELSEDNDGQLIIYTGLVCENSEDFWHDMPEEN